MPNYNSYSNPSPYYGDYDRQNNYLNYGLNNNNRGQQNLPQNFNGNAPETYLKGKPVTSIEEARAQSFDLDGSITYFPDITNKRIYTKQFNPDGSASFKVYIEDTANQDNLKYVTQQELVDAVAGIKSMINGYVLGLMPPPQQMRGNGPLDPGVVNTNIPKKEEQQQSQNQENPNMTFNI